MRAGLAVIAIGGAMTATTGACAAAKLAPQDIQATFFNSQPFVASTPSNIRFTMVFRPDGRMSREPVGKAGFKGEGKWTLSKDGFCTEWKGSKAQCFVLVAMGDNKWSVVKGATTVATWSK